MTQFTECILPELQHFLRGFQQIFRDRSAKCGPKMTYVLRVREDHLSARCCTHTQLKPLTRSPSEGSSRPMPSTAGETLELGPKITLTVILNGSEHRELPHIYSHTRGCESGASVCIAELRRLYNTEPRAVLSFPPFHSLSSISRRRSERELVYISVACRHSHTERR